MYEMCQRTQQNAEHRSEGRRSEHPRCPGHGGRMLAVPEATRVQSPDHHEHSHPRDQADEHVRHDEVREHQSADVCGCDT